MYACIYRHIYLRIYVSMYEYMLQPPQRQLLKQVMMTSNDIFSYLQLMLGATLVAQRSMFMYTCIFSLFLFTFFVDHI